MIEPKDCQATLCAGEADQECKVCGKPICNSCARMKSWARGCCSKRQSQSSYLADISYGPLSDPIIHDHEDSFYDSGPAENNSFP